MNFSHLQKTLLCVIFITGSVFSFGQFTVYNTLNSDLPYNTVRCVEVNPFTNEVWAGTDFGLARFDGTVWTVYNTLNSGLTDDYIRSVETDPSGNMWIGTLFGGLFMFDGISWVNYNTGNSNLPDNQIKDIEFDQDGYMWVATTGGLAMHDGNSWTIWNVFNSSFPTNNISSIKIAPDNSKRIGAVNGGLQIISADNLTVTTYWSYNSSLIDNTILMVDFDLMNYVWMATPSGGLIMHAGGDNWVFYNTLTSTIPTNSATYIFIDDDNKKYVPTIDDGLVIYDGITFGQYNMANSNLPDNYLFCLAKDTSGMMWMGSYNGGLIKFNPATLSVEELEPTVFSFSSLMVSSENVTVGFTDRATSCTMYDLQGKSIYQTTLNATNATIPVNGYHGVFVFSFSDASGAVISAKVFIP